MSKASAETRLALFERMGGRGDVLSIPVEKGAELAALPKAMFAEILYPLFRWWIYGDDTEPSDPRDKMVFAGLKTHQIENAVKRGVNLANWQENASKGGRPPKAKKPNGNQTETKRIQLEEQDEGQVEDARASLQSCNSSSVDGADRGGQKPPVCPSLSVAEARKTLAMYAPDVLSHAELKTKAGVPANAVIKYVASNADQALLMIAAKLYEDEIDPSGEGGMWHEKLSAISSGEVYFDDAKLPNAFYKTAGGKFIQGALAVLEKILNQYSSRPRYENKDIDLCDSVFKCALLDGYISAKKEKAENPAAWIIARLNKVNEAVGVIEAAKDAEESKYPEY